LAPSPGPACCRLGEGGLDDVFGRVAIARQQVGKPQQGGGPRGDERPEVVLVGAIHRLAPVRIAVMHLRTRSRVRRLPTSPPDAGSSPMCVGGGRSGRMAGRTPNGWALYPSPIVSRAVATGSPPRRPTAHP